MTSATSRTSWISRIPRNRLTAVAAVVLAALLIAGVAVAVRSMFFGPKTITAYFTSATAIYPGDQVRVSGVKVGTIKSIQPQGTQAKMTLHVDHDVPDSGGRESGHRHPEPGRRPLRRTHSRLPDQRPDHG